MLNTFVSSMMRKAAAARNCRLTKRTRAAIHKTAANPPEWVSNVKRWRVVVATGLFQKTKPAAISYISRRVRAAQ